jgi:hypothetical protein
VEKIWSVRQNACVDRPGPPIDDGGTAVTIDLGAPDLAEPAPSNGPENHPPPDLLPSSSQRELRVDSATLRRLLYLLSNIGT